MPGRNTLPYEVIAAAPIALYTATPGVTFPTLDEDPDDDINFTKVGLSGDLSYDDAGGVSIEHPQNMSPWRSLGDSGSRKVFRVDEDCTVKVKVMDLRLETYSLALNGNTVTPVAAGAGTAGYKKIGLSRGLTVDTRALLIRALVSPYGAEWIGQYKFPRMAQTGKPTVQFLKKDPAGLELEWMALVDSSASDPSEYFGVLEWGNADATS